MKHILKILALFPFFVYGQVVPDGCIKQVNIPAEYVTEIEYIEVPAVIYQKPLISKVTKDIIVKEKAVENYFECGLDGTLKHCSRTVQEIREKVTYDVVNGYENIVLVPQSVKEIKKQVKVKDGYIAHVPCDKIIIK